MDLNELRQRVMAARQNPEPRDSESQSLVDSQRRARTDGFEADGVVVTPEGVLLPANAVEDATRPVSRVTSEIFAAGTTAAPDGSRAAGYLPANHQPFRHQGFDGWIYDLTTRQGRTFTFFLYWDRYDATYEVVLISPEYEKAGLTHEMHIFPSGRLCLTDGTAITDIQNAFGRSAMWADGVCQMLDGHSWPWGESDDLDDEEFLYLLDDESLCQIEED